MGDPYNSFSTANAAPTGPRVPIASNISKPDRISRLDIAESWKPKFRLIEKAGGPNLRDFRSLSASERMGLNFNVLAFFFGPLYYLAKGLWRQAIAYLICAIALVFVLEAMGFGGIARAAGYGFAAVYAMRANVSYYSKMVLGKTPWF